MGSGRWRIILEEEAEAGLPVPWQPRLQPVPPPRDPVGDSGLALGVAIGRLLLRGPGPQAWTASYRHDPIAFLLDAVSDAVNLWSADGTLLFRNAASQRLALGRSEPCAHELLTVSGRHYERRCLRYAHAGMEYILEVLREQGA